MLGLDELAAIVLVALEDAIVLVTLEDAIEEVTGSRERPGVVEEVVFCACVTAASVRARIYVEMRMIARSIMEYRRERLTSCVYSV